MEGYVLCDEEMLDIELPFDDSLKAGVVVMDIQKNCGFRNIVNRVDTMFNNEIRRVIFRGVGDTKANCMACVEVIKKKRQPYEQAEFREDSSVTDHVHNITRLTELSRESKKQLCLTPIDLWKPLTQWKKRQS
ncbi:hypothetical protein KIN20_009102 [Parelaphostrongylus tenuis]|uniref:DNA/RNA-binding protein Alba-like domain-containing protein n=1 Tax=Parelaphostrongylus tenuis TaxID=148309 RepID=A0AAD5M7R3_PARTN|nr:hypothetical protein KIN20_009102 [Parelaphostrongylus tenuis]